MPDIHQYIGKVEERYQAYKPDRDKFLHFLQGLYDIFDPNYVDTYANKNGTSTGVRGDRRIYDSKGIQGVALFSNALHSNLYPQVQPFFQFSYSDEKRLFQEKELRDAFAYIDQDLQKVFQYKSNFHPAKIESLTDYVIAGEETLFVDDYGFIDKRYGDPIFRPLSFDRICYAAGIDGEIDTHWRSYRIPARLLPDNSEFEESISKSDVLKQKIEKESDEMIEIIHYATPKKDVDVTFMKTHEYISLYYTKENKIPLNLKNGMLSGFEEQAIITNRYRVRSGETTPRSDTMGVFGDAQSLQRLAFMRLKLAAFQVDPMIGVNPKKVIEKIKNIPGATNYLKDQTAMWYMKHEGRMDVAYTEGENLSENVMAGFHKNDFRFPEDLPQMTATEAQSRLAQMQGQHSPIVVRSVRFIAKVVERVFWMRYRAGKYIDYFPILQGLDRDKLKIEVISPLAKAQRANDVLQLQALMRFIDEQGQLDPSVLKMIKKREAIEWMSYNINSAFPQFIKSQEEIEEESAQEQALAAIPAAADAAKSISQAVLNNAKAQSL